jgi:O-acetylhomoserine (thiol)-lyase
MIAIYGGYDVDPITRSVAGSIYQRVFYALVSAEHGESLFNLEPEGYRYTRIENTE